MSGEQALLDAVSIMACSCFLLNLFLKKVFAKVCIYDFLFSWLERSHEISLILMRQTELWCFSWYLTIVFTDTFTTNHISVFHRTLIKLNTKHKSQRLHRGCFKSFWRGSH